ncbi:hypothetical protein M0802_011547 [Mischocyttarus mexicanus]|nr:hypothetical protein M0802_011547 [Mischocyttarus mexicanus]
MFAFKKAIGSARFAKQIVQQRRTLVDLPPSERLSVMERVLAGLALTVSMLGLPTYIAYNFKNYSQKKG